MSAMASRLLVWVGCIVVVICCRCLPALADDMGCGVHEGWPLDAQSTSGPFPPMQMAEEYAVQELDYEVIIAGVPAYKWKNGCGPTAAGMVIGYWDIRGFDDLVSGDAETQTTSVNNMISSAGNYNDYCIPKDYSPNPLLSDQSEQPPENRHPDDSVADFMKTSQSFYYNYYGWSWFSDMDDGLKNYALSVSPYYEPNVENVSWASFTWQRFRSEIDAGRPVIFLIDRDGDVQTDHFVTAIGYGQRYGVPMYACFNTWDMNIHWYEFAGMDSGQVYGIYGATTFFLNSCDADFYCDGDVDGSDLTALANDPDRFPLSTFASAFGRTDGLE